MTFLDTRGDGKTEIHRKDTENCFEGLAIERDACGPDK
eukprot:CAMPEP_0184665174 /NCGR_PEP_ID=MMETSP0308-20130426/56052_1 /TAXON_ID=38269 /ORGANISM="Gloeochaete witrockiana, Strain SAG 46.84" /LENGTH=37 /DNA_ID= /DNA_START= /DNA_END= /DNA_ORIENTATION=